LVFCKSYKYIKPENYVVILSVTKDPVAELNTTPKIFFDKNRHIYHNYSMFKILISLALLATISTSTISLFAQGNFDASNPCLNRSKVASEA
jgi:hypothetical protein